MKLGLFSVGIYWCFEYVKEMVGISGGKCDVVVSKCKIKKVNIFSECSNESPLV